MCGIFCHICKGFSTQTDKELNLCRESLINRGPNSFQEIIIHLSDDWYGLFFGSILWTQGSEIVEQPIIDKNVFLWNGDVYSGLENEIGETSDTKILFSALRKDPKKILRETCGPYSFIYWDSTGKKLWFGRDIIGRHSLLWSISSSECLLTSVGNNAMSGLLEVPSCGIFMVDLSKEFLSYELHPWHSQNDYYKPELEISISVHNALGHQIIGSELENFHLKKNNFDKDLKQLNGFLLKMGEENLLQFLLKQTFFSDKVKQLETLLFESVKKRVQTKPEFCKECIHSRRNCNHAKIGVLFSGGLDSTLLALIADKFLPQNEPIDLYNVAFERKANDYEVPDRKTGRLSLKELEALVPSRKWHFVEINVTKTHLSEVRSTKISSLIYPLDSILDDSLGCALWFAASGNGLLNGKEYQSLARIVLLGMGADELFGGYSRHRKVFLAQGWEGLCEELSCELKRIGERNLGRDNRVVADHGRQPRTPFLDENFVRYVTSLPPWHRCCLTPEFPPGYGDKLLLRLLAWHLGLRAPAMFPKRALQFGSRIANPKEKGHEKCQRLAN